MATGVDGIIAGTDKVDQVQFTQRFARVSGSSLVEYQGWAVAGTAAGAAGWRIRKLKYTGNDVDEINWADGDTNFDNIWTARAGLSYS